MSRRLADVPAGVSVRVEEVEADRKTLRRLAELGLTPGVVVEVLQVAGGPALLAVRGSRLAVDRAMARRIRVTDAEDG